eukprot:CAMPEP_0182543722 /NCGR_PEP_ID=MMETSP1323-20130603/32067_1 /TAXON_ID=236787 /ORGANISM="Florenciella parvula, Strain RCC1693" /LENGTH=226 /DNA_ID=CAMNT_0024754685 /DNA_START=122 /DNA_END=802 /DNA_ORIENTATION=-
MKFLALVLALALTSASAFVPACSPRSSVRMMAEKETVTTLGVTQNAEATYDLDLKSMPGIQDPVGYFDPWGLAVDANDDRITWFRSAELKHSRVAMLAFVGWVVTKAGYFLPGNVALDGTSFKSLGANPLEAYNALPENGKWQMILTIGLIEISDAHNEKLLLKQTGPTDGSYGLRFDPLGFYGKMSEEKFLAKQNTELANGRLAMIGIAGSFSAELLPHSVPFIP